jgi:hypothetical protein
MNEGNAGRLAYKVFRVMEEPENYWWVPTASSYRIGS